MDAVLRGDLPRLSRATSIVTESASSPIKRSKPLKYAYEKEIVLYAHHKKLEYFSTECIYSPEAFRGSARALVKNLEKIRPSAILDIVRSGEDMARLVPESVADKNVGRSCGASASHSQWREGVEDDEGENGCSSVHGRSSGGEMAAMERKLLEDEAAGDRETEISINSLTASRSEPQKAPSDSVRNLSNSNKLPKGRSEPGKHTSDASRKLPEQRIGQCQRCGYMSSQAVCKACVLLDSLNKNRPTRNIGLEESQLSGSDLSRIAAQISISDGRG